MGIIKTGILGGFRKKTGTVVGAFWRRLDVIRALPRSSGKAPSQKQLDQQRRFALVTGFLSNFSELIDIGFDGTGATATPMNLAVRYHFNEAITGTTPNFALDFAKVAFSRGKLMLPLTYAVANTTAGQLDFSWLHEEANGKLVDDSDELMVLVYNAAKNRFVKVSNAAIRSANSYTLPLPASFAGDEVEVYMAFNSALKRGLSSDTIYLGNLTLS